MADPMISTVQAASVLGIRPGTLAKAVWDGRVSAPAKGPGGAYHWTIHDIERASLRLLGRSLTDAALGRLSQIGHEVEKET